MKIPPEVIEKIKGNNLEKVAIKVEYTNYKGRGWNQKYHSFRDALWGNRTS